MRLCLIPSTICSNWRRNCSLAAEEDMALRDRRTEHTRQHACSHVLVTACFYSLLEVVVDRVEQIHLQTGKQRWAFGRCRWRCCVHWPPSPGKPSCRLACCTAWRTASSLCAWQKLKQRMWESLLLSGLGKHRAAHTHLGCRAPGTSSGTESARPDWAPRRSSSAGRRSHGSFEPECRSEVTLNRVEHDRVSSVGVTCQLIGWSVCVCVSVYLPWEAGSSAASLSPCCTVCQSAGFAPGRHKNRRDRLRSSKAQRQRWSNLLFAVVLSWRCLQLFDVLLQTDHLLLQTHTWGQNQARVKVRHLWWWGKGNMMEVSVCVFVCVHSLYSASWTPAPAVSGSRSWSLAPSASQERCSRDMTTSSDTCPLQPITALDRAEKYSPLHF